MNYNTKFGDLIGEAFKQLRAYLDEKQELKLIDEYEDGQEELCDLPRYSYIDKYGYIEDYAIVALRKGKDNYEVQIVGIGEHEGEHEIRIEDLEPQAVFTICDEYLV